MARDLVAIAEAVIAWRACLRERACESGPDLTEERPPRRTALSRSPFTFEEAPDDQHHPAHRDRCLSEVAVLNKTSGFTGSPFCDATTAIEKAVDATCKESLLPELKVLVQKILLA